jgi:hypothetical protein
MMAWPTRNSRDGRFPKNTAADPDMLGRPILTLSSRRVCVSSPTNFRSPQHSPINFDSRDFVPSIRRLQLQLMRTPATKATTNAVEEVDGAD